MAEKHVRLKPTNERLGLNPGLRDQGETSEHPFKTLFLPSVFIRLLVVYTIIPISLLPASYHLASCLRRLGVFWLFWSFYCDIAINNHK